MKYQLRRRYKTVMKKFIIYLSAFIVAFSATIAMARGSEEDVLSLLSELKVMQGDGNGNYNLDNYVSRAECTKVVVALSTSKDMVASGLKISPFSDVKYKDWFAPYIQAAVTGGLCEGYIDGSFHPNARVTYEEAVTMFLRALGYTNDDFGMSWPYGQIGMANNLEITDGVGSAIGEELTRRQIARMAYNTLKTNRKGANAKLLSVFDCAMIEDVTLISTSAQDSSLADDKVLTSSGTYKVKDEFNQDNVGKKGDLVIKNGEYIIAFAPSEGENKGLQKYVVYSILDNAVVCYSGGSFTQLDVNNSTTCYYESLKTSYGQVKSSMEMGDVIYVRMDGTSVDYVSLAKGDMTGPYMVRSSEWTNAVGTNSTTQFMRDGNKVAASGDIITNDIVYYSKELNMVMAYSDKVTGVYESASPTRDTPSSVKISGVEYKVESVEAFNALSSSGNVKIGDTITVCLGKNGDIAGVVSENITTTTTGFVIESGTKKFTDDNNKEYTSYYVKMVDASGAEREYTTSYEYDTYVGKVCTLTFQGGKATIKALGSKATLSGRVSADANLIGSTKIDENVKIVDVAAQSYAATNEMSAAYAKIFLQRLDGVTLNTNDVLYVKKNDAGAVTEIIIDDVTGDAYSFGIVTNRSKSGGQNETYSSTIDIFGQSYILSGINAGMKATPIKCLKGTKISNVSPLASYGKITNLTYATATVGANTYKLSDKVSVYHKNSSGDVMRLTMDEAINGNYSLTAYYDRKESDGGRIRVILAQ